MTFASREDAGRRLGEFLRDRGADVQIVLGLPRGGVIVAAEVSRILNRPLGVLVVRKIGHPFHREFAVGALAENNIVLLDPLAERFDPTLRLSLEQVIREETERMAEYRNRFHPGAAAALAGQGVLLVDDGLATGATTEAAVLSAQSQGAAPILVATPVASTAAVQRIERTGVQVIALFVDSGFDAVGRYYRVFNQTSDDEVLACLEARRRESAT